MRTLHELLSAFQDSTSSDLHLTEDESPCIRVNGDLFLLEGFEPFSPSDMAKMTEELVGQENFERFNAENELDMAIEFKGDRMRVNIYRQQKKIAWALRLLPSCFFPLDKLGLSPSITSMACTLQK